MSDQEQPKPDITFVEICVPADMPIEEMRRWLQEQLVTLPEELRAPLIEEITRRLTLMIVEKEMQKQGYDDHSKVGQMMELTRRMLDKDPALAASHDALADLTDEQFAQDILSENFDEELPERQQFQEWMHQVRALAISRRRAREQVEQLLREVGNGHE